MNLSTIITGVPEYIEFAQVCAPNAAAQSITANTITTLILDTEVSDSSGIVSAPSSNRFTLPAGTYYYEASSQLGVSRTDTNIGALFSLYNYSDTSYVSRSGFGGTTINTVTYSSNQYGITYNYPAEKITRLSLNGQIAISASKIFELRALTNCDAGVCSAVTAFTNSTERADQRTTIKLWKLK
jgi:hypothetical protein